jgi:hypothetical protein
MQTLWRIVEPEPEPDERLTSMAMGVQAQPESAVEPESRAFAVKDMSLRKYDFLINHCQSSGQDQCGKLALLLQQAGASVWYDMQAQDLTAQGMEEGVSESRNLLIFLSDDCFGRPFCNAEQRWGLLYGCNFVGVVEKDSRHHPADFGQEKARAPTDLKRLLDDVEYIEYRRRDFEAAAMVRELLRRGGVQPAAAAAAAAAAVGRVAVETASTGAEPEPEPHDGALPEGVPPQTSDSYEGLTNEEDFRLVGTATTVHIISTPWVTNVPGSNKAKATKMVHDNTSAGVYTFNPNTGLRAAAAAEGLRQEEQGKKWLQLWTSVCKRVQDTGGTCFVMAKGTGLDDFVLEGNTQQGEVNVAELAGVAIEYVYY